MKWSQSADIGVGKIKIYMTVRNAQEKYNMENSQ